MSCLKCVFVLYTCSISIGIEQRLSSVHVIIVVTCGVLNYFVFRKVPPYETSCIARVEDVEGVWLKIDLSLVLVQSPKTCTCFCLQVIHR